MKSLVAPLVNLHVVRITTQFINVQCFPLHAGESSEKSSVDTRNLQHKNDAERIGHFFVLKDLIEDGIPCAFNKTVGRVWIDLTLNNQDFWCVGDFADFKECADPFSELLLSVDLLQGYHLDIFVVASQP